MILLHADAQTNAAANRAIGDFVSMQIWERPGAIKTFRSLGIFTEEGMLIAGILYHNHYPDAGVIEISGAATNPRFATRPVIREMFEFPFRDLGCQLIVMRVGDDDYRLNRMLPALGFDRFAIPRLRGRDTSELIFTLTDDDWFGGSFCTPASRRRKTHGQA